VIGAILALVGIAAGAYLLSRARSIQAQTLDLLAGEKAAIERDRAALARETEAKRKELDVEAKELALAYRQEVEKELKGERTELQRMERRLEQKEEALDKRHARLEDQEEGLRAKHAEAESRLADADKLVAAQRTELERVAGLSSDEARATIFARAEDEMRVETARLIRDRVEEAEREADARARDIVTLAVQRCAVDQVAETTVSVVPIPSDDVKGRIIGREGRNIRNFEALTGCDLIIDDTPEAVVISGFDPVRREVARTALTALVTDGRIHPGRIEEVVEKSRMEVEQRMKEAADEALLSIGAPKLHPELIKLLGKLKFRTSYGQNVLAHSVEMAHLAGLMADQLGLNATLAKRGAILHDIGKACDHEVDGNHIGIACEIARRCGESEDVVNCIEAHHGDVPFRSMEAVLVQTADAISASRPGARRESIENYIKRLEGLERIANSFGGVEKSFAIQAGREIRVMVAPDRIDDALAATLARDIARRIEEELQYPGQIRVTVVREVRAVEVAK